MILTSPSDALKLIDRPGAGNALRLESVQCPVGQENSENTIWRVGRSLGATISPSMRPASAFTAACWSVPTRLERALLSLGQRFRTHLTDKRWAAFRARLQAAGGKIRRTGSCLSSDPAGCAATERHLEIKAGTISARLDRRRRPGAGRIAF